MTPFIFSTAASIAVVGLVVFANSAQAQSVPFERIDTDDNGVLSFEELSAAFGETGATRALANADLDGDDTLTTEEIRVTAAERREARDEAREERDDARDLAEEEREDRRDQRREARDAAEESREDRREERRQAREDRVIDGLENDDAGDADDD